MGVYSVVARFDSRPLYYSTRQVASGLCQLVYGILHGWRNGAEDTRSVTFPRVPSWLDSVSITATLPMEHSCSEQYLQ